MNTDKKQFYNSKFVSLCNNTNFGKVFLRLVRYAPNNDANQPSFNVQSLFPQLFLNCSTRLLRCLFLVIMWLGRKLNFCFQLFQPNVYLYSFHLTTFVVFPELFMHEGLLPGNKIKISLFFRFKDKFNISILRTNKTRKSSL